MSQRKQGTQTAKPSAALIAASPELLDVLLDILSEVDLPKRLREYANDVVCQSMGMETNVRLRCELESEINHIQKQLERAKSISFDDDMTAYWSLVKQTLVRAQIVLASRDKKFMQEILVELKGAAR